MERSKNFGKGQPMAIRLSIRRKKTTKSQGHRVKGYTRGRQRVKLKPLNSRFIPSSLRFTLPFLLLGGCQNPKPKDFISPEVQQILTLTPEEKEKADQISRLRKAPPTENPMNLANHLNHGAATSIMLSTSGGGLSVQTAKAMLSSEDPNPPKEKEQQD